MTPELKAAWIAALRSGEYKQGHEYLHQGEQFCCLGVLCEVAGGSWTQEEDPSIFSSFGRTEFLFLEELESFGLSYGEQTACYSLNDGTINENEAREWGVERRPHSFDEIADWIERNIP